MEQMIHAKSLNTITCDQKIGLKIGKCFRSKLLKLHSRPKDL